MADLGNYDGVAYAYEKLSLTTTTVVSPTVSKLSTGPASGSVADLPARAAMITVETVAARYTCDGSTVTATDVGHLIPITTGTVNNTFFVRGQHNVSNLQFINDTGSGTSTVHITYLR